MNTEPTCFTLAGRKAEQNTSVDPAKDTKPREII